MKYRIRQHLFPSVKGFCTAEYKIMGIWMKINTSLTGNFIIDSDCQYKDRDHALKIIKEFKLQMKRSKQWTKKHSYTVEEIE